MKTIIPALLAMAALLSPPMATAALSDSNPQHAAPAHAGEPYTVIPMSKVESLLGTAGIYVFDVNMDELWTKHHLPSAIHVDNPDLARFLPVDRTAALIFYCARPLCGMAPAAAREAALMGYGNLFVMEDGILGWD
jgi:rhodanese-related sulfurtransferase